MVHKTVIGYKTLSQMPSHLVGTTTLVAWSREPTGIPSPLPMSPGDEWIKAAPPWASPCFEGGECLFSRYSNERSIKSNSSPFLVLGGASRSCFPGPVRTAALACEPGLAGGPGPPSPYPTAIPAVHRWQVPEGRNQML